jgi:Fur family transcriptional regulator, peroxide stress response regulator
MNSAVVVPRTTKYCLAIETALSRRGHATNSELHEILLSMYPEISATTIHRATARLSARGSIRSAPSSLDGAMRYDSNPLPHDHFMCTHCGTLQDIDVKETVVQLLKTAIRDCDVSGRLVISGRCKDCSRGTE